MPRRKAAVIAPPRDTSSDEAALRTLYRKDPSRILPNALWKTVARLQSLECRFIDVVGPVTGIELREPGKLLIYGTRTQDPLKAAAVKLDGVPRYTSTTTSWLHLPHGSTARRPSFALSTPAVNYRCALPSPATPSDKSTRQLNSHSWRPSCTPATTPLRRAPTRS